MRPHPSTPDADPVMHTTDSETEPARPNQVRITVRGRLSDRLATAFEGMTLVPARDDTALVGELSDRAHLHGLLTRIRDLGLELACVTVSPRPSRRPR
jgi:hypothetical protein